MYMITDSLTCRPQKGPDEAGRHCRFWCRASWPAQGPSCPPGDPCGAARASRPRRNGPGTSRPALPPASPGGAASGYGHLTRSRPQDSPSNAAAPQWEPRKPLGGTRKPRREAKTSAGLKWGVITGFGPSWATRELQPLKSVTQADSVGRGAYLAPSPCHG